MNIKKRLICFFNLIIIILTCSCSSNENSLLVDVIDVDQGDSILLKTPDNYTLLVDSGESDYFRNVMREIKKNRIRKLDYVLGTHSDSDHIGSMEKIISNVPTDNLILSEDNDDKIELKSLINKAHKKRIRILRASSGDRLQFGKFSKIYFLSPRRISKSDPNKNSLVFLLKYNHYNLMFTGDADSDNEKEILRNYNLPRVDFLKAGHHGSKTSSCDEFISHIKPKITAISCGQNNRYGHPHKNTISTLNKYKSKIYRTDKLGSIYFYFEKEGVFVK